MLAMWSSRNEGTFLITVLLAQYQGHHSAEGLYSLLVVDCEKATECGESETQVDSLISAGWLCLLTSD